MLRLSDIGKDEYFDKIWVPNTPRPIVMGQFWHLFEGDRCVVKETMDSYYMVLVYNDTTFKHEYLPAGTYVRRNKLWVTLPKAE